MIDVGISARNEQSGGTRQVLVGEENSLRVEVHPGDPPPVGSQSRLRYFSGLLGTTGLDSGTTDMATTAASYYVQSDNDYDIRVMLIILVTADAGATHNDWGNIGTLSTGVDLILTEAGVETALINKAQTHGQALAQTGFARYHSGGSNAGAFTLTNWTSTQEAQSVIIPMNEYVPGGLRIGRGTQDQLTLTTNDDMSGVDEMFCRVIGYRHYP